MSIDKAVLADARLSRVLTQYRESPNLLGLIEAYLLELAEVIERADAIPAAFDIDTSTGDQLTLIGKWLGFPRVHPRGKRVRAFGFERLPLVPVFLTHPDGDVAQDIDDRALTIDMNRDEARRLGFDPISPSLTYPVAGFCDSRFLCDGSDFEAKTFTDDAEYRRFLKARAVSVNAALTNRYSRDVLTEAATALFGSGDVVIVREGGGSLTLCLTRFFTESEKDILHMAAQVLPLPLGVKVVWAHSDGAPFGAGDGWGEFCTSSFYGVIRESVIEQQVSDAFGFGPGFAGFCNGRFLPQS